MHVWTTARNRMMAYYACAVRSYFTYIAECGSMQSEHHNVIIFINIHLFSVEWNDV